MPTVSPEDGDDEIPLESGLRFLQGVGASLADYPVMVASLIAQARRLQLAKTAAETRSRRAEDLLQEALDSLRLLRASVEETSPGAPSAFREGAHGGMVDVEREAPGGTAFSLVGARSSQTRVRSAAARSRDPGGRASSR